MTQKTQQNFHLIIAAAGYGARFGGNVPKQYYKLAGKALLRHTIDNAYAWGGLQSINVIIGPDDANLYHDAVMGLDLPPAIQGSYDRKSSISNALNAIHHVDDENIILIHDAVRPFTTVREIEALLDAMNDNRAASLGFPLTDTVRRQKDLKAGEIIERDGLWALQTPQAFRFGDLKAAHAQKQEGEKCTDDTSLVSALGIDVALVKGEHTNIKITTMDDLKMAEIILSQKTETRTGHGFDVHAFEKKKTKRPLMLCGIHVEHPFALAGHSDADVGLHALTDALLGAIGQGDIGQHFPPSDPQYKDMDSAIFLQKAADMLISEGAAILNIDLTLICEEPKIGPYRESMCARIGEILGIETARINVKATTTEGLGFTGRGEGIAAQAVATIKVQMK